MLESFGYFALSINFTVYLSAHFDFSDTAAGTLYGVWGFLISVFGLLTGPVIVDKLGVRLTIVFAGLCGAVGRATFALAESRAVVYIAVFLLLPLSFSCGIPVMQIAVKVCICGCVMIAVSCSLSSPAFLSSHFASTHPPLSSSSFSVTPTRILDRLPLVFSMSR